MTHQVGRTGGGHNELGFVTVGAVSGCTSSPTGERTILPVAAIVDIGQTNWVPIESGSYVQAHGWFFGRCVVVSVQ